MKKFVKKFTVALIVAMMAVIMIPFSAAADDTYTVYADVPDSWGNPNIWAWTDGGGNVYATWPGEAMDDAGDGLYSKEIPVNATNVIINAAGGTPQTLDLKVTGADCKISVNDDNSVTIEYLDAPLETDPVEEETTVKEEETTAKQETPTEQPTQATTPSTTGLGPEGAVIIIAIVVVVLIVGAIIFVVFKKQ